MKKKDAKIKKGDKRGSYIIENGQISDKSRIILVGGFRKLNNVRVAKFEK